MFFDPHLLRYFITDFKEKEDEKQREREEEQRGIRRVREREGERGKRRDTERERVREWERERRRREKGTKRDSSILCLQWCVLNPLWGHRSISIDSDLGALQPYFFAVMVTPAPLFFACMQLNDKRSCWRFEKSSFCTKSCRLGPLKVHFPPSSRPAVELYAVLVLVSGLLSWQWTVCHRSILAAIYDSVVWRSIFRSERTLPSWGSLIVCQWPGELEKQRRKTHSLRFWRFVHILDHFSWRRFLANFSVCHELLDLFFVISETKTFRQGEVAINKSASFFW